MKLSRHELDDLKGRISCVDLARQDIDGLERESQASDEWHGPCPLCGGDDRFLVRPSGWLCRQCKNGGWNDAFDYMVQVRGLSFPAAVRQLSVDTLVFPSVRTSPHAPADDGPPGELWQALARRWANAAVDALWSEQGERVLEWLRDKRGLTDETIRAAGLGWNRRFRSMKLDGRLHVLESGITIPRFDQDAAWALNVRLGRAAMDRKKRPMKYQMMTGSRSAALYRIGQLTGPTFVTEGEFDAMLLAQETGHAVCTTGSASSGLDDRWIGDFAWAAPLILCFDDDQAGRDGAQRWRSIFPSVRIATLPAGKDITEAWAAGVDLAAWAAQNVAGVGRTADMVE